MVKENHFSPLISCLWVLANQVAAFQAKLSLTSRGSSGLTRTMAWSSHPMATSCSHVHVHLHAHPIVSFLFFPSPVAVFSRSFNPLPLPPLCLQLRLAAFSRRALVPHPKYNYRPQLNGEEGSPGEPSEQEMVRRAGLRRERQIPNSIG